MIDADAQKRPALSSFDVMFSGPRNAALVLAVLCVIATLLPAIKLIPSPASYLPIHTAMEFFAIAVASLSFTVVWSTRERGRSRNELIIGGAFLAVALIDFGHTLSYQGMPDFITPSGSEKAINFWLLARLLAATALLIVALQPLRAGAQAGAPWRVYGVFGGIVALAYVLVMDQSHLLPRTFVAGEGLTPFKIGVEYLVIAVNCLAALLLARQALRTGDKALAWLAAASWTMALAEQFFTLYAHVTDVYNLLGHIYKVFAYVMVYRALFLKTIDDPYLRLAAAREELHQVNQELEQRVADRTRNLEAANRELEAFSYSVSHDLRAPLRAIEGLVQALASDETARLSSAGRGLVERIGRNSGRMSALIDEILAYSRSGRLELRRTQVDLDALVQGLANELGPQVPHAHINIGPLGWVEGDPTMLRQIWQNLIGNALKYSARREQPLIEVSASGTGPGRVFAITDNGAGFDMDYAEKLFGMFQRMHGEEDFPGTGVGLAITRRLVERHDGQIWAEAAVDRGASFRFTLAAVSPAPTF